MMMMMMMFAVLFWGIVLAHLSDTTRFPADGLAGYGGEGTRRET